MLLLSICSQLLFLFVKAILEITEQCLGLWSNSIKKLNRPRSIQSEHDKGESSWTKIEGIKMLTFSRADECFETSEFISPKVDWKFPSSSPVISFRALTRDPYVTFKFPIRSLSSSVAFTSRIKVMREDEKFLMEKWSFIKHYLRFCWNKRLHVFLHIPQLLLLLGNWSSYSFMQ